MAFTPITRRQPPPVGSRISSSGLGAGLMQFYRGVPGGKAVEEISGQSVNLTSGWSLETGEFGTHLHNDGTGAALTFDYTKLKDDWGDEITVVSIFHLNGVTATNRTFAQSAGGGDDAYELSIDAGNDMGGRIGAGATWSRSETDILGDESQWSWGAMQRTEGVGQWAQNPNEKSAVNTVSTAAPNQMAHNLTICSSINSTAVSLVCVAVWDRELTLGELKSFFTNPWNVFTQPSKPAPTFFKKPWTKQPPAGTPINKAHPLAKDLIFAYLPNMGGGIDSVTGIIGVPTVTNSYPVFGHTGEHQNVLTSINDNGSSNRGYVRFNGTYPIRGNGLSGFTLVRRGPNIEPYWATVLDFENANNTFFNCQWSIGSDTGVTNQKSSLYDTADGNGTETNVAQYPDWDYEPWWTAGFTLPAGTGVTGIFYADAELKTSINTINLDVDDLAQINVGGTEDWPTESYDGDIAVAMMFGRQLSAAEHRMLHDDPWSIFEPRKILMPAPPNRKLVVF